MRNGTSYKFRIRITVIPDVSVILWWIVNLYLKFGCKDHWTADSINKFGCDSSMGSISEEELSEICVGSFMI